MKEMLLCAVIFLATLTPVGLARVASQDEKLSARVGIQVVSQGEIRRALTRDRLRKGDQLRIYVEPRFDSHVYVLHTDHTALSVILDGASPTPASERIVLPAAPRFFEVDGTSSREFVTVICSPRPLPELEALISSFPVSLGDWEEIEDQLALRGRPPAGEEVEAPFAIGGNVRDLYEGEAFADYLIEYFGDSLILKRFEFRIAK